MRDLHQDERDVVVVCAVQPINGLADMLEGGFGA